MIRTLSNIQRLRCKKSCIVRFDWDLQGFQWKEYFNLSLFLAIAQFVLIHRRFSQLSRKKIFRETRLHSTSNNSVENTIIRLESESREFDFFPDFPTPEFLLGYCK